MTPMTRKKQSKRVLTSRSEKHVFALSLLSSVILSTSEMQAEAAHRCVFTSYRNLTGRLLLSAFLPSQM